LLNATDNVSRIDFAKTGLIAITKYPLGISNENYLQIKKEMSSKYSNPLILQFESHNGFVNFGLHFTLFGLLLMGLQSYLIIRKVIYHKLNEQFLLISSLAYIMHVMVHNKFIFIDDFSMSVLLALFALEFENKTERKSE